METKNEFVSLSPMHPGRVLLLEIEERGINQRSLAEKLGVAASNLNDYIHGKRNFTAEFALKLEDVLDIPASNWVNMQANYDLTLARVKRLEQRKAIMYSDQYAKTV